jgi:hypothetical protein
VIDVRESRVLRRFDPRHPAARHGDEFGHVAELVELLPRPYVGDRVGPRDEEEGRLDAVELTQLDHGVGRERRAAPVQLDPGRGEVSLPLDREGGHHEAVFGIRIRGLLPRARGRDE